MSTNEMLPDSAPPGWGSPGTLWLVALCPTISSEKGSNQNITVHGFMAMSNSTKLHGITLAEHTMVSSVLASDLRVCIMNYDDN